MKKDLFDTFDPNILRSFEIIKKISQGVWKVKNKKTSSICAIKKISSAFGSNQQAKKTYREIKYLQKLQHPNMIKLIKIHKPLSWKDVYLQFQFMEADLCLALKNSLLKQIHKQYIFYQVINALVYLHTAQLIHRDIKPSNILINEKCEMRICDFSMIRSLVREKEQEIVLTQNVSTRWYRAPEILLCDHNYGKPADIWSVGCVLAEMILRRPLFQGGSTLNQLQKIFQITGKPLKEDLHFLKNMSSINVIQNMQVGQKKQLKDILHIEDQNLCDLLENIFQINPLKRPTAVEILNHPSMIKFKDKVQCKTSQNYLKIPYETQILSIEDYMGLIYDQHSQKINEGIMGNIQSTYKTLPNSSGNIFSKHLLGQIVEKSPLRFSNMQNVNQKKFSPIRFKHNNMLPPRKEQIIQVKLQRLSPPSFLMKRKENSSLSKTPQKNAMTNFKVQKKNSLPIANDQKQGQPEVQKLNEQSQLQKMKIFPSATHLTYTSKFSPKIQIMNRLITEKAERNNKNQQKNARHKQQADPQVKKHFPLMYKGKQLSKTPKKSFQKSRLSPALRKSPLHFISKISPLAGKINIQIINNNNITIRKQNSPSTNKKSQNRHFYPANIK